MKRFFMAGVILAFAFACNKETTTQEQETPQQQDEVSAGEADVAPQKVNGNYVIDVANQQMAVNPEVGGRIASFQLNGEDFLTGKDINPDNWGSTFWTSPQSAWGWPPSEEIDKKAYSAEVAGNSIVLTSQKDQKLGYEITKEIFGNPEDTSYTVKYTITNKSDSTQKVAPWEISRVYPGGITFYPTGQGEKRGDLAALTQEKNGVTWFDYPAVEIPGGVPKLLADGSEGWLGQVNDGTLLVKSFEDVPLEKNAPEEGEIELYTNPDKSYIEIEQQGAYEELQPGASTIWEVKWFLRELPEGVNAEAGSEELVSYVRSLVN